MFMLSEIIQAKLIPWSQKDARKRFIVAGSHMRQVDMPHGVQLVPHKIHSKRVVVKKGRSYHNVRNIIAVWPDAGLHELSKYLLICVLDGFIDYQLGSYRLQCGPGHFIFIPPGLPRPDNRPYVDLQKSTTCKIATFVLHPHALECWMTHRTTQQNQDSESIEQSEQSHYYLIAHERAASIFESLMKEVIGRESKSLQIGEGLLSAFFNLLQREVEAGNFQSYRSLLHPEIETIKMPPGDFLAHLESYVQTNLSRPLTLDVVAAEVYLSRAQFTRVMRRETGKSFNEFLCEQRLKEAKRLLLHSQWTINTVAALVGFKSASYFRTFFKHYAGLTPTEFRRRGLEMHSHIELRRRTNPPKN
jgi:AraC-like DNA-binding protein